MIEAREKQGILDTVGIYSKIVTKHALQILPEDEERVREVFKPYVIEREI
jgi:hypothetical protein